MVLIKGGLSALSGLGYEVTFQYRNKTARIRLDKSFFPSVSSNIVFDQIGQDLQKWKQYLTIPLPF